MLLMVEKGIRGGVCHSICRYAEANNKYMKDCDKKRIAISSILGCKVKAKTWSKSKNLSLLNR